MIYYPFDFENGYKIRTVFANKDAHGGYGDIYNFRSDAEREHPDKEILIGYCVISEATGLVPDGCNDWNETIVDALNDYEDHVAPTLKGQEEEAEKEQEKTIDVVLLEPGQLARRATIDASLQGLQKTVGGYIEAVYPYEEAVCLVCNEEGKLIGLPLNRALRAETEEREIVDIIAGTCFICDCSGEDFGSLSEEQLKYYEEKFKYPEQFLRINDEILAVPYKPEGKDLSDIIKTAKQEAAKNNKQTDDIPDRER